MKRYTTETHNKRLYFITYLNERLQFLIRAVERSNMPYNKLTIRTYLIDEVEEFITHCYNLDRLADVHSATSFKLDLMISEVWEDSMMDFAVKYDEHRKEFLDYPKGLKKADKDKYYADKIERS